VTEYNWLLPSRPKTRSLIGWSSSVFGVSKKRLKKAEREGVLSLNSLKHLTLYSLFKIDALPVYPEERVFFFFFLLVTLKRKNTIFLSLSLPTLYIVLLYYQNLIVFLPRITSLSLSPPPCFFCWSFLF
jgi:hypothetical protein